MILGTDDTDNTDFIHYMPLSVRDVLKKCGLPWIIQIEYVREVRVVCG